MARKRFITSNMSTDEQLAKIASENPVAALMWPWFITGFDDWGRMTASPLKIKLEIFPAFPYTVDDIEQAIQLYSKYGLVHLYEVDSKQYMAIDPQKFYYYQTYIPQRKRDTEESPIPAPVNPPWEQSSEVARKCAQTSADERLSVPSPSPSPSLIEKDIRANETPEATEVKSGNRNNAGFDRFWDVYPRKVAKQAARKAWDKLNPDEDLVNTIVAAVERQRESEEWKRENGRYIPYPATYLNGRRWEDEDYAKPRADPASPASNSIQFEPWQAELYRKRRERLNAKHAN